MNSSTVSLNQPTGLLDSLDPSLKLSIDIGKLDFMEAQGKALFQTNPNIRDIGIFMENPENKKLYDTHMSNWTDVKVITMNFKLYLFVEKYLKLKYPDIEFNGYHKLYMMSKIVRNNETRGMVCREMTEWVDEKGLDDVDVITIVSSDNVSCTVSRKEAMESELIKTILSTDKNETTIRFPNVSGNVLERIVKYLKYHITSPANKIDRPLRSTHMRENVCEWDAQYIDSIDSKVLFEIIIAANYLDIKSLLDLACAKVASMIKNKSRDQVKELFDISRDCTPEEEAVVRADTMWADN